MTKISQEQYDLLIQGIADFRVQKLQGKHMHLTAWDVRRYLIRVFGFDGFDVETKNLELVREIQSGEKDRPRWTIVYRAEVRLSIKVNGEVIAVFEDAAAGDAINQPSIGDAHDLAMKTALSQALKRCAVNLGDQFGLSLYGKTTKPAVLRSLVTPGGASSAPQSHEDAPVEGEGYDRPITDAVEAQDGEEKPKKARRATPTAAAQEPDPEAPGVTAEPMMTEPMRKKLFALLRERDLTDRGEILSWISARLGWEISSSSELTKKDAQFILDALTREAASN